MKETGSGIAFALLWSSAAVAVKYGLPSSPPLALATLRFLLAGGLLLGYCYGLRRGVPWPGRQHWGRLLALAFTNTTLYLGLFFLALQHLTAGLAGLFVAANPLLISLLSGLWLKRRPRPTEWAGMGVATLGLALSTGPALRTGHASALGVDLLAASVGAYSLGSVLFARFALPLPTAVVNLWQVLLGGLLLLPVALLVGPRRGPVLDAPFWGALLWLAGPVSIGAMQLWYWLLRQDAVRAAQWLYLTPVFGYLLAWGLLHEPLTAWAVGGTAGVLAGLYLARRPASAPPAGTRAT